MSKQISDYLVVSDMDGTLLRAGIGLPQQNVDAVRAFSEAGGHFTVATGRHKDSARRYLDRIQLSAPAILCNGALIYDYQSGRAIRERCLAHALGVELVRAACAAFPDLGAEIMCPDTIYVAKNNHFAHRHTSTDRLEYIVTDVDSVPQAWYKVLFCIDPEEMARLEAFLQSQYHLGVYFVKTAPQFLEVMADGVNKGEALHFLADYLGLPQDATAAIGDYYNDLELLRAAHFSATLADAPQDIKVHADMVCASCLEGGVAEFLGYLRQNCGRL